MGILKTETNRLHLSVLHFTVNFKSTQIRRDYVTKLRIRIQLLEQLGKCIQRQDDASAAGI